MTTNKKLAIVAISLIIAIVLAFSSLIVALVLSGSKLDSVVSVHFVGLGPSVEISASCHVGGNTTPFTVNGISGGSQSVTLANGESDANLSQVTGTELGLTKLNDRAVFIFKFKNLDDTIDVKISLTEVPEVLTNINLSYCTTTNPNLDINYLEKKQSTTTWKDDLIAGYEGEETSIIAYVFARITDVNDNAEISGNFSWALSFADPSEINTYTLDTSQNHYMKSPTTNEQTIGTRDTNYVERVGSNLATWSPASSYIFKTLKSNEKTPDVYPAKAQYYFDGWVKEENVYKPVYMNATVNNYYKRNTSNNTWYIERSDGNDWLVTDGNPVIVPDLWGTYSNGKYINVGKLTQITDSVSYNTLVAVPIGRSDIMKFGRYLEHIGERVFSSNNKSGFTELVLPEYVKTLDFEAFSWNRYVTSIIFTGNKLTDIGIKAFTNCGVNSTDEYEVILPDHRYTIRAQSFAGCNFTSFVIPDGIRTLGSVEEEIKENEWTPVTNSNGNTSYIRGSYSGVFYGCSKLETVKIGNNVSNLEYFSFQDCKNLKEVYLNENLSTISEGAFYNCTSLENIFIPSSVKSIEGKAFSFCNKLNLATFGNQSGWKISTWTQETRTYSYGWAGTYISNSAYTSQDVSDPILNAQKLKYFSERREDYSNGDYSMIRETYELSRS